MFQYFKGNPEFDFVANILANVAGFKDGRLYMLKNKFYRQIVELMKSGTINNHRMCHLAHCVRNLTFEYE